jgi:hypothetical protein
VTGLSYVAVGLAVHISKTLLKPRLTIRESLLLAFSMKQGALKI